MRTIPTAIVVVLALQGVMPAHSQGPLGEPFGNLISPEIRLPSAAPLQPGFKAEHKKARFTWLVGPMFADADTSQVVGAGFGFVQKFRYSENSPEVSHVMRVAFASVDPEGGEARRLAQLSNTLGLWTSSGGTSAVSWTLGWTDLEKAGTRFSTGFSASRFLGAIGSRPLEGVVNLGWSESRPNQEEAVDAFVAGLGLGLSITPSLALRGDYTLDNKVDGEDSFSVSLSFDHLLGPRGARLVVGVKKHGTLQASYTLVF